MSSLFEVIKGAWRTARRRGVPPLATPVSVPPGALSDWKTDKAFDSPLARAAAHESGHALTAWWSSHVRAVEFVTIEHEGARDGLTSYVALSDEAGSDAAWCEMVVAMAGMAAEVCLFGNVHAPGCTTDLMKSLRISRVLLRKTRWKAPPLEHPLPKTRPPFQKIYLQPVTPREDALLAHAYTWAYAMVRHGAESHVKLLSALLAARTLRAGDLESILGSRAHRNVLGAFRTGFVVPGWKVAA